MLKITYIGIGSNIGRSSNIIEKAISVILSQKKVFFKAISNFYITKPIGYKDQPDFFNVVLCIKTSMPPVFLLKSLLRIEKKFGRKRSFKNAPRTLDLDILDYQNIEKEINGPVKLTLPHPRLHTRAFVLRPLIEIEKEFNIPGLGRARNYLESCHEQKIVCINKKPKIKLIVNQKNFSHAIKRDISNISREI